VITPRPRRRAPSPHGGPDPPAPPWAQDGREPFTWTGRNRAPLYEARRDHLDRLRRAGVLASGAPGTVEPADGRGGRSAEVALALQVDLLHADVLGWDAVSQTAWGALTHLGQALSDDGRRFHDRGERDGARRLETSPDAAAEDAHGGIVLAVGEACGRGPDRAFRGAAAALFRRAVPGTRGLTQIRATAAAIIGCEAARRAGLDEAVALQRTLVPALADRFELVAWSLEWPWPEPLITAESALPARALIVAGRRIADRRMVEMGLAVLEWLVKGAVAPRGHLSPVGDDGWWARDGARAAFDQLPSEPVSIILASETAFLATGDRRHLADMERAYAWFLGANDLGVEVADPDRGGCRDGLGPEGARLRQGPASTLAWLTALEHARVGRRRWAAQ